MQQKRQIIFLTKLYSPHVGGVEKHVQKLTENLISKNFSVIIITEQHEKGLTLFERRKNLKIYRIPIPKNNFLKKFYIWKWIFLNIKLLRNADIIHVHDVFYWVIPFRIFMPRKKIFVTFHGYEGYPIKLRWKIIRKISEKMANGNICVGDFMKKWYKTRPNYVIYGAVEEKSQKKDKFKRNSIVFFGRFDPQTNILEYAKAFNLFLKKNKNFTLTVYGDGNLKNKIKKPIIIKGFKNDISNHLYKFEYVFVSRYLSMLEALVSKRLVFAYYDNEIKRDYVLKSPFKNYVIPVSSPIELSKKLEYYFTHQKEKQEIVERGYSWAKKQTWGNIVTIYLRLWGLT